RPASATAQSRRAIYSRATWSRWASPGSGPSGTRSSTRSSARGEKAGERLARAPPERHALEALGVLHAGFLAIVQRPCAQELVDPLALADLRDVGAERLALDRDRVGDVDVGVGWLRAADEDFLHLVRLETIREQLLEDHARLGRRKHGVERGA